MSVFDSLNISASGLSLERLKLDTISTNVANANTEQTAAGGPYQKKTIAFEEVFQKSNQLLALGGKKSFGVRATEIISDEAEVRAYDPTHPLADQEGYVLQSNVNMADEMVDMMTTIRAYDANITALDAGKNMLKQALTISSR